MVAFISYLLEIDKKTWTAFKARLKEEGTTVKWALAALIRYYIDEGREGLQKRQKDKDK